MKRNHIIIALLVFVTSTSIAQKANKDALNLVKELHGKQLGFKLRFANEINAMKNKNGALEAAKLYESLSQVYLQAFTSQEITSLLAFCNSPLGRKKLDIQERLSAKTSSIILNWEMEQQGVAKEEMELPRIEDHETSVNREPRQPNPVQRAPFPKINTLEDLKQLVLKDRHIIADYRLLLELLGPVEFEKLFDDSRER